MATPIPPGSEGLIPHLVCDTCADAIEFYKRAFDAEEINACLRPMAKRIMRRLTQHLSNSADGI